MPPFITDMSKRPDSSTASAPKRTKIDQDAAEALPPEVVDYLAKHRQRKGGKSSKDFIATHNAFRSGSLNGVYSFSAKDKPKLYH
jgi:hypothetical protein